MKKPEFFIVGAPKCGTTALSEYLRVHKSVFMCDPKEPHYFADNFEGHRPVKSLEQYEKLFNEADAQSQIAGEASVWYMYSGAAIKNIHQYQPDAKLIVMLRNPVQLVQSLHQQHLYSLYELEENFENAWKLQQQRAVGNQIPRLCRQPELLEYGEIGKLSKQLSNIYEYFLPQQVLVLFLDDFMADTRACYHQVLEFLELEDDGRTEFEIINPSKSYRSRYLRKFIARMPMFMRNLITRARFSNPLNKCLVALEKLLQNESPKEELSEQFTEQLIEFYRDDILKLTELTGRDLSHWLSNTDSR